MDYGAEGSSRLGVTEKRSEVRCIIFGYIYIETADKGQNCYFYKTRGSVWIKSRWAMQVNRVFDGKMHDLSPRRLGGGNSS